MDDADRADKVINNTVADGLSAIRRSPSLVPAGFCHFCGEAVQPSHLFCDTDCRDDYDHMQARRKANA